MPSQICINCNVPLLLEVERKIQGALPQPGYTIKETAVRDYSYYPQQGEAIVNCFCPNCGLIYHPELLGR